MNIQQIERIAGKRGEVTLAVRRHGEVVEARLIAVTANRKVGQKTEKREEIERCPSPPA